MSDYNASPNTRNTQLNQCDKCGEVVERENDAAMLEMFLQTDPSTKLLIVFAVQSRHLLPTESCEGSPSRAQYLEGQSRDTRTQYSYDASFEDEVRAAYNRLLVDVACLNLETEFVNQDTTADFDD
jgi:hypothetical protein